MLDLEKRLELIDERNNDYLEKEIKDIEKELSYIYDEKAKGAQIRSKEKWVKFGEKTIPTRSRKEEISEKINKQTKRRGWGISY